MVVRIGGLGNDSLTGEDDERNVLYGDAYWSLVGATGGNDTLTGGANSPDNTLYGETEVASSITGGSDILTGGANSTNYLYGDAKFLTSSTGGNDALTGGANSTNYLYGDALSAQVGDLGNDTLTGGANSINYLYGDAKMANGLSGTGLSGGDDRLVSGANAEDHMRGDFGPWPLYSTGGNDTFVSGPSNGNDYIHDFHQGEDHIELDGIYRVPIPTIAADHLPTQASSRLLVSFADLNVQTVDTDNNSVVDSSIIHFDADNSVTVYGITNLIESDFFILA